MSNWRTIDPETLPAGRDSDRIIREAMGFGRTAAPFAYTTDIGAAYELLEGARKLIGERVSINRFYDGDWRVHFEDCWGRSESLPLAISRAFLMWMQQGEVRHESD